MKASKAKSIASEMLNTAKKKIWIAPQEQEIIKEAITREDIRELIEDGTIRKKKTPQQSRGRSRELKEKKKKGRKRGRGKRKASKKKRTEKKKSWIKKVRAQRKTLRKLREEKPELVEKIGYRKLYKMIKGNYFRGKKYLEKYVEEKGEKK